MRAVVQRVLEASVVVGTETVGAIDRGLLVFVGVANDDGPEDVDYIATKVSGLRIFDDDEGRMNKSVADIGGAVLLVSQFTLHADARKGRRPSFDAAAPADVASSLYAAVAGTLRATGLRVEEGRFQALMRVRLVNDGPVTILLDSRRTF